MPVALHAQDTPTTTPPQTPAPTRAQPGPELQSPRLIEFPGVELPEGGQAPGDARVEVTVRVATDGSAQVDDCALSPALCGAIADAIARARFEPGLRGGEPIVARVRIALSLAPATSAGEAAAAPAKAGEVQPAATPAEVASAAEQYGATAHAVQPVAGMRRLELAEMRDLPGAFGDPFRAVEALPGIVPVVSGLPYFYVRGSPPAGTLYVYDNIPMPTLYHLAVGPAVIHPRMVGPVRLYAGVAPARYGRLTGGVVVGEGPPQPDGETHAEAELRLLDVSGYVRTPGLGGEVAAAVRYGYPALLLSVFSPQVNLAYWDYQLRYTTARSGRNRFELVALGSYDSFNNQTSPGNDLTLTFHRVEPRFIRRFDHGEYGAAMLLGWEESQLGADFRLRAARLGPRAWWQRRWHGGHTLRLSTDLVAVRGDFSGGTSMGSSMGRSRGQGGRAQQALYGDVPARSMWGVQAEVGIKATDEVDLQFGGRADAWLQSGGAEAVLDPRARVTWHTTPVLDLHIAGGVVHQPAVFYLPLPGLADVANAQGLQAAIQTETGVGWDTPLGLRAEVQFFWHRYQNLVFVDALALEESYKMICNSPVGCDGIELADRIDGMSYGTEFFLRRPVGKDLSGWISYTLARSLVDDVAGVHYTPTWDVRHLGNLVLQWQMGGGFSSGARVQARSGKVNGEFLLNDALMLSRDERRLPWFVRLDLQLAYAWKTSWARRLRASLEWFNATLTREPVNTVCTGSPRTCNTVYLPAIFFPNLGLRGEL